METSATVICDMLSEAILWIDAENRISYANQAAANLTGLPLSNLQDLPFEDLFAGTERNLITQLLQKPFGNNHLHLSNHLFSLNGSAIALRLHPLAADQNKTVVLINAIGSFQDPHAAKRDVTKSRLLTNKGAADNDHAMMDMLQFAAVTLANLSDWRNGFSSILQRLGTTLGLTRAYLFQYGRDDQQQVSLKCQCEWVAPGISPIKKNLAFGNQSSIGLKPDKPSNNQRTHKKNNIAVNDLNLSSSNMSAKINHSFSAFVPVIVENQLWGFIGADAPDHQKQWTSAEQAMLKTIASILGSALKHRLSKDEASILFTAIEQAVYGVTITDDKGIIRYVNDQLGQITGYRREEVLGQHFTVIYNIKNDKPLFRQMLATISKGSVWRGAYLNTTKAGKPYEEQITISPIQLEDHDENCYIISNFDATEKKRLETIAAANNLMENTGYIFSGIRHEIGNPLNSLKMTLSVLLKNYDTFSKPAAIEFLERSLNEAERIEYLLNALRNFNMFEKPKMASTDIHLFLNNFLDLASEDLKQKGIQATCNFASNLKPVQIDPRALQQVLLNIITNAVDACMDQNSPEINIATKQSMEFVEIIIEDNGCGMTVEQQQNLFKPFYTNKPQGTGLGLVISKKMLSSMGITIHIKSRLNQGTKITLKIPENYAG